ncbi:exosome complex exonuclease RRP6 [Vairimorpha necatrix]|uniref:Exosome complex exonuclease RRP6 n=1 Tax=Vairimorpha necatrix TaxID=6039 RepID=A0AAX4J8P8_9MICR
MKKLAHTAQKFINNLNKLIKKSNDTKIDKEYFRDLLSKIREIKSIYKFDESLIYKEINTNEKNIDKQNVSMFVYNDEIVSIFSKTGKILQNKFIKDENLKCDHIFNFTINFKIDNIKMVDDSVSFNNMLSSLDFYLIDVFDHSYRSYNPYVCYISILSNSGFLYIVDVLKCRSLIIDSGLLTCKFQKIFPNIKIFKKLKIDFKNVTCYKIGDYFYNEDFLLFSTYKISPYTYIDWRIDNLQIYLKSYICDRILQFSKYKNNFENNLEKDTEVDFKNNFKNDLKNNFQNKVKNIFENNFEKDTEVYFKNNLEKDTEVYFENNLESDEDFLYLEKDTELYFETFRRFFISKYLLEDDKYLEKLIRNREAVALNNNESIYYVMTNDQLAINAKYKFKNEEDFIKHDAMTSSIVKQNLNFFKD